MEKPIPTEETLKQRSRNKGDSRFEKYSLIKKELLDNEYIFTLHQFPGGNDHGPNHIKRVLEYLDKLVAGDPWKTFLALNYLFYCVQPFFMILE